MAPRLDRREMLLVLGAAGVSLAAVGAASASPRVAPPEAMRKGFNLPDQAPARRERRPDEATLRALRRLGFTHVRLPIAAEFFLPALSGPATVASAQDDVERALESLLRLGYVVSVDMHPDGDFQAMQRRDPQQALAALRAGWRGLAGRLAHWPTASVFAELLNEPAMTDDAWRGGLDALAAEVRTHLAQTTLIVGPAPFQRLEALAQWRPLDDRNVVYAAHFYDPLSFTHQGATWDIGGPTAHLAGVPFPLQAKDETVRRIIAAAEARGDQAAAQELRQSADTGWTGQTIDRRFADLALWSARHAAPVIVNEFGVLRDKAPRADRLAWLVATRAAAEASGFGWAHWDYASGFGLLDGRGRIDQETIGALLGRA